MKVKVTLTPNADSITYLIHEKIICSRNNVELKNTATYSFDDLVWHRIFHEKGMGKFILENKKLVLELELSDLGYDRCDSIVK